MKDLFCEDINVRAAAYADKRYPSSADKWLWHAVADAYVEGAASQRAIDETWRTGITTAKIICAIIEFGNSGNRYYDVLQYHNFMDLQHPAGHYDTMGELIPCSAIKEYRIIEN